MSTSSLLNIHEEGGVYDKTTNVYAHLHDMLMGNIIPGTKVYTHPFLLKGRKFLYSFILFLIFSVFT